MKIYKDLEVAHPQSGSLSTWFLVELEFENVGFWGQGKTGVPEKNLSEQGREPTTNSTHIWRRRRDLNPGHISGRRVLSPLRHPCSPRTRKRTGKWSQECLFLIRPSRIMCMSCNCSKLTYSYIQSLVWISPNKMVSASFLGRIAR